MPHLNIEIKARCYKPANIHAILRQKNALYKGVDLQIDTYFNCPNGRLKLRQGNIENSLIHYQRPNQRAAKSSIVHLYHPNLKNTEDLRLLLMAAYGVKVVVRKKRAIYFIDNIKFHIDEVDNLGNFVEIEAIDATGDIGKAQLMRQCEQYVALFGIVNTDLVQYSYSDMLLSDTKP